ncbi:Resolvase/invertase-type recombinase catalytic domain-containing protein, partial [Dysosmobacter welbionis]
PHRRRSRPFSIPVPWFALPFRPLVLRWTAQPFPAAWKTVRGGRGRQRPLSRPCAPPCCPRSLALLTL